MPAVVAAQRAAPAWREALDAAKSYLGGRSGSLWVEPTSALYALVSGLVPWEILKVQVAKVPKRRRLPYEIGSFHHRACVLLYDRGDIEVSAQALDDIPTAGEPFSSPVDVAIFVYGTAPATSFGPDHEREPPKPSELFEAPEASAATKDRPPRSPRRRGPPASPKPAAPSLDSGEGSPGSQPAATP